MQDKSDLNNSSYSINSFDGRTLKNNSSENLVELPLPSKNQHIGKKIVKKLLIEGENVLSKTQFNSKDNTYKMRSLSVSGRTSKEKDQKNKSNSTDLRRANTVVNYENRRLDSVNTGEFDSKLLGSPNSGSSESMTCAAMFGKQYLLIGNENGLSVIDFSINSELMKPKPLIRGCSFRKIQILDEYGIMIAIAGKKLMVRIYRLGSLLHLIKFMLNSKTENPVDFAKTTTFLKKITDSIQRCEDCGTQLDEIMILDGSKPGKAICQNCKELSRRSSTSSLSSESNLTTSTTSTTSVSSPTRLHHRTLSNITSHLTDYIQQHLSNSLDGVDISAEERTNVWHWATDYIKLLDNANSANNARDCITFDVKETRSYIYLTVVTLHNTIHLFNCDISTKNTLDFKFELANIFWVPGTPDFISVTTDTFVIKNIYTAINGKVAYIDTHSTIVTEINMPKSLIPRFVENPVWRSFTPLPHTCSLEFLIQNPVEFDTQISVIPLSPNLDIPSIPKSLPTSKLPITPPPSESNESIENVKFVNELRNNPLRRSTYRHRKSASATSEVQSSGIISYKKSRRRSRSSMTDETLNSVASPLDSVISMFPKHQRRREEQPTNDLISPPISPTFTNILAQQGTISTLQQPLMGQLDFAPFPAPPERSSTGTISNEHPTSNISNPESSKMERIPSENKQQTPIEVPLPSNLFLATVCNVSHLVNDKGEPYKYNRPIRWSSSPNDIVLLPSIDDIYIVGFQDINIELASMKSGEIKRKITSGCPVKFLGESLKKKDFSRKNIRGRNEKQEFDSGMRRNIFWICQLGEDHHFYRGRIHD